MSEFLVKSNCQQTEIAAYLDGELSAAAQQAFERHCAECAACNHRVNEQKAVLFALDAVLTGDRDFNLPKDFARTIVVRAESDLKDVRSGREQLRAGLLIVGWFALGVTIGVVGRKTDLLPLAVEQTINVAAIVARFLGALVYDLSVSSIVIARAVGRSLMFGSPVAAGFLVLVLVLSLIALSGLLKNYHQQNFEDTV